MGGRDADPGIGSDGSAEFLLLSPEDWRLARDARLAALRDSPTSFLPTQPPEPSWSADQWRHSCETGLWAVARARGTVVGLARLTYEKDGPHLGSVWTHPRHRLNGIAAGLISMLMSKVDGDEIFVWVIRPNRAAIRLYESLGFVRTDEVHRLDGIGRDEERLRFSAKDG
jgi:ribosomal protein S18 acetylase RimI-like enzyme